VAARHEVATRRQQRAAQLYGCRLLARERPMSAVELKAAAARARRLLAPPQTPRAGRRGCRAAGRLAEERVRRLPRRRRWKP